MNVDRTRRTLILAVPAVIAGAATRAVAADKAPMRIGVLRSSFNTVIHGIALTRRLLRAQRACAQQRRFPFRRGCAGHRGVDARRPRCLCRHASRGHARRFARDRPAKGAAACRGRRRQPGQHHAGSAQGHSIQSARGPQGAAPGGFVARLGSPRAFPLLPGGEAADHELARAQAAADRRQQHAARRCSASRSTASCIRSLR